ncbi:hypothetical protein [Calothrix sp. UHCC 0171]|uniref:hypothetical protein n=1 Tax=Calothrix sp. UHCC 0171 TaxID=3110245 RepID=UPI002B20C939|nr:hypothetical protein [Calothrix sp. UHCC 0171]MEA5574059.1 hypothetical protein [Calothrix sp. UHCC 0171]
MSDLDLIQHLSVINQHLQVLQSARPTDKKLFETQQLLRNYVQNLLSRGEKCSN